MRKTAQKEDSPLSLMILGVVIMVIGVALLLYLNKLEAEGGRMRMNAILALVYTAFGKWGVFGFCDLLGLGIFVKGALRFGGQ
jgi:hypothetical protein